MKIFNLKILYLLKWEIDSNDGVTQKVSNQVEMWEKFGHHVKVFCISNEIKNTSMLTCERYKNNKEGLRKFKYDIRNLYFDFIYLRWMIFHPFLVSLLKNNKVVVEINSNDIEEYKLSGRRKIIIYNQLTRKFILKKADLLCFVSNEISHTKGFEKFRSKTIVFPNTTNLDKFYKRERKKSKCINLCFIGTKECEWQGLDILLELVNKIKVDVNIHIIGYNGKNSSKVFYYGYLNEDAYRKILKQCDIAVGTLALFRKSMSEASPLKVREYAKYKFPIILGYEDTAFLNETPEWVLRVPNNSEWINDEREIEKLERFILKYWNFEIKDEQLKKFFSSEVIEKNKIEKIIEKLFKNQV